MDLSARQLRTGIRSPGVLARELLKAQIAPVPPDTPRSPQRPWMDASLRRYFERQRDPSVLLADYERRTAESKRRESAASEIANGRKMLERFLALDQPQVDPTRFQMKPVQVELSGHRVLMGADVAYQTLDGWIVRHLITDEEIRQIDHLRLYATAAALHFEGRPDGGPVAAVEIWLLRYDRRVVGWPRSILQLWVPRLAVRLDEIARGASSQAA